MSATSAALRGQVFAESLMTEVCTVTRITGQTFDSATGGYTDVTETVYTGKCRVHPRASRGFGRQADVAERPEFLWPYVVALPMSATGVAVSDLVTVTTSGDPDIVGKQLRVQVVARGENITARRLDCEEMA